MANTSELNRIEGLLSAQYCKQSGYIDLRLRFPELSKHTSLERKPDIVAMAGSTLLIAEITCSGFMGYRNRKFHLGATRKLAEIFLKLTILQNNTARVLETVNGWKPELHLTQLKTCMIVPEGSQFIQASAGAHWH